MSQRREPHLSLEIRNGYMWPSRIEYREIQDGKLSVKDINNGVWAYGHEGYARPKPTLEDPRISSGLVETQTADFDYKGPLYCWFAVWDPETNEFGEVSP